MQVQQLAAASGFSAQNGRRLHFGLGAATAVERVVIRWPSGREQTVEAPAIDRLVSRVPNARSLKESILSHHTSAEDAGRIAKEAGVGLLVLSHLVPPDDPSVTDEMWIEAARKQPTISVLWKLAAAIELTPAEFAERIERTHRALQRATSKGPRS